MKKRLLSKNELRKVITLLFYISSFSGIAQISSTTLGGNWGEPTTWVGGNIPTATDNVIIAAGATVSLDVAGACNNLTVNGSFVLNTASISFISTGTTTINVNGVVNFTSNTISNITRSFNDLVINNGGSWNSRSFVTLTGNITNNGTFSTLTNDIFTLSGENKTLSGSNISISCAATITGSYINNSTDLKFIGNLIGSGSLTNSANRTLYLMGATNSIATLNAGTNSNSVVYGRFGAQTVISTTYHNLNIEGNLSKSMQGAVNINNTLQINSGATFYDNGYDINGATGSTLNVVGELQLGAGNPTTFPTTFDTVNINSGSTIHYSSINFLGQVIDHTLSFHHLRVSGATVKKITGSFAISGNLTISSGTLDVQNFDITVKGDAINTGNQMGDGKIILNGGTSAHTIRGNFVNLEINDNVGATMSSEMLINGTLFMTLGPLRLESYRLVINGYILSDGQGFFFNSPTNNGEILIFGGNTGNVGNIYMASPPNNTLRYFTMNRPANDATVNIANDLVIKQQCNLDNGNVIHNGKLTLGLVNNILTTRIINGTVSTPLVFNNFTGAYRVQYGLSTLLSQDIIVGTQGEIPANNTVDRIILSNLTQFKVSLTSDITVTGTITFQDGKLFLGDYNLITTYTSEGPFGVENSYIVTNGSGQFFRTIPAGVSGSFYFPVGYNSGYSRAVIEFIDNTNMSAGRIGVRAIGTAPTVGNSENYLKKHWIFTDERQGASYTYRPTFGFKFNEVTGLSSALLIGRFNGTTWDLFSPSTVFVSTVTSTVTMQSGSINQPINGNGIIFSALSEPTGEVEPVTVWDIIVNSADHNTLESAIILAELDETLQGEGPFTVFAPTDAAFESLPPGFLDSLNADPSSALADLLKYHVVGNTEIDSDQMTNGQTIVTLNGQSVTVNISGNEISINNALITIRDLIADNGVVHVIDAVLIPEEDDTNVNNILSNIINIYPNPAKESFFIDCSECKNFTYELMTIDGKVVRSGRLINEREQISKGDLSAGIYLVKIFNENSFGIKKIILQ